MYAFAGTSPSVDATPDLARRQRGQDGVDAGHERVALLVVLDALLETLLGPLLVRQPSFKTTASRLRLCSRRPSRMTNRSIGEGEFFLDELGNLRVTW